MTQGTKRKADALEEVSTSLQPATNGFYIKHAPEKGMTGVDANTTRLCASVAGQIYSSSQKSDFKLALGDIKADVVHFEDHGDPYGSVTPDMVIVVSGTTMILGWQGTSTISDAISDFHMVPITSSWWSNVSKEIKIHGGFVSIIDNDLSCLESFIVKKMEENKITELVTTGHSLGGALAQVAQLCIQASLHDKSSIWSKYKESFASQFSVRSVAFSAPMSISTISSSVSTTTKNFLHEVAAKSCNIIYGSDIVPRGFSGLAFIDEAIKNIIDSVDDAEIFAKLNLPWVASFLVNVREKVEEKYEALKKNEHIEAIIAVAMTFNHYGNIIHYENDAAKPLVYRDYNHDESSCDRKFSDLKWEHQDISMDIVGNLTHDHNNTVRGPGLAYHIPYDKLAGKCYMMDEFEILRNYHDVGSIEFNDWNDCVKKAKEEMHTASYAAVAVWDRDDHGKEKFNHPGRLYIKKNVPGSSSDASARGVGFWNKDVKYKATFWRTAGLDDWVTERSPAADIHDGVVELK